MIGQRIWISFQERQLLKLSCLPSVKGSILKGKNLLLQGADSFLLEYSPFHKWPDV